MILTFEVQGRSLDIHFDAEGRDQLVTLLNECVGRGDHRHLFRLPIDKPRPSNLITQEQFDEGSNVIEEVTLWLFADSDVSDT